MPREHSLDLLLELAASAEHPGELGTVLGTSEILTVEEEDNLLPEGLGSPDDALRELARRFVFMVVLAQDRDRIAREPAYHYLLRREFEEHGTKIHALNDRSDESPEGELMDGILDQLAKFERAKTAERSRRGKLRKAREGKGIATTTPDYGFRYNDKRDGYVVDEEAMRVVRRIFREVGVEGRTAHAVKASLDREGVKSPGGVRYWN